MGLFLNTLWTIRYHFSRGEQGQVARKKSTKKYKLKTHKATAKRFKYTGSGKLVRTKGPKSHLRRNKSKRVRNQLSQMTEVTSSGAKRRVRRLAPYLKSYGSKPSRPGSKSTK
jgi:large subunit ribosomal protein L35